MSVNIALTTVGWDDCSRMNVCTARLDRAVGAAGGIVRPALFRDVVFSKGVGPSPPMPQCKELGDAERLEHLVASQETPKVLLVAVESFDATCSISRRILLVVLVFKRLPCFEEPFAPPGSEESEVVSLLITLGWALNNPIVLDSGTGDGEAVERIAGERTRLASPRPTRNILAVLLGV